jgi:hypothetical protein
VRRLIATALLAAAAAAGCGSPSADLFVVKRSGADRNANLTLLVADDGSVTCNGKPYPLTSKQLLTARALARDLSTQAVLNLQLPPGPNHVLSYRVRLQAGDVSFADTSKPLPRVFTQLTVFTKDISEDVCGINRR